MAHRIIWAIIYDDWPPYEIDHIDTNRTNNRAFNLREATRNQNAKNLNISTRNATGFKGVSWNKSERKFRAYIACDGKQNHLGFFDSKQEAHKAYCAAADKLHGNFSNHGNYQRVTL